MDLSLSAVIENTCFEGLKVNKRKRMQRFANHLFYQRIFAASKGDMVSATQLTE